MRPEESHVRGHLAYRRPASRALLAAARLTDFALVWILILSLMSAVLGWIPSPDPRWILSLGTAYAIYLLGFRAALGRSLGDALWRLRPPGETSTRALFRPELLGPERFEWADAGTPLALTAMAILIAGWLTARSVLQHPLWMPAKTAILAPFLPPLDSGDSQTPGAQTGGSRWSVNAFFYALGAWPSLYRGNPVFHLLPYRKGPPERFPGLIQARWDAPHTVVTFEGPKTPLNTVAYSIEHIKNCLKDPFPWIWPWSCAGLRKKVLLRHIEEMSETFSREGSREGSPAWKLAWVEVENPALEPQEQVRGFWLSAQGASKSQERFILITPKGAHQAFILEYPTSPASAAEQAKSSFESAIRSLRTSDDLSAGRAWAERRIEEVKLTDIEKISDPRVRLERLTDVQALLISRISVFPGSLESYFHLGGVSLTLARLASQQKETDLSSSWSSIARRLIQDCARFAEDIAPGDPKTRQLQNYAIENKN